VGVLFLCALFFPSLRSWSNFGADKIKPWSIYVASHGSIISVVLARCFLVSMSGLLLAFINSVCFQCTFVSYLLSFLLVKGLAADPTLEKSICLWRRIPGNHVSSSFDREKAKASIPYKASRSLSLIHPITPVLDDRKV
jgi:hypothetical protein